MLGNREHKKTNFPFWGNRETSQFASRGQGNCNWLIISYVFSKKKNDSSIVFLWKYESSSAIQGIDGSVVDIPICV